MSLGHIICAECHAGRHERCMVFCTCTITTNCRGWKAMAHTEPVTYEVKNGLGEVILTWMDGVVPEESERRLDPCCEETLRQAAEDLAGQGNELLDMLAEWLMNRADGK